MTDAALLASKPVIKAGWRPRLPIHKLRGYEQTSIVRMVTAMGSVERLSLALMLWPSMGAKVKNIMLLIRNKVCALTKNHKLRFILSLVLYSACKRGLNFIAL